MDGRGEHVGRAGMLKHEPRHRGVVANHLLVTHLPADGERASQVVLNGVLLSPIAFPVEEASADDAPVSAPEGSAGGLCDARLEL